MGLLVVLSWHSPYPYTVSDVTIRSVCNTDACKSMWQSAGANINSKDLRMATR